MRSQITIFLLFFLYCIVLPAADHPKNLWEPHTQYLHDQWDVLPGHADVELFKPEVAAGFEWGTVDVPGLWMHANGLEGWADKATRDQTPYMWYRRRFDVPVEAKYQLAVLRLAAVRWGSLIWINGKKVGGHLGAFGVNDFSVAKFLRPGEPNEIVMRLTGWSALPRSAKRGQPLVPPGSAPHSWGMKSGGVSEFITLHYFDETYIRSARILADPATGTVDVRVRLRNYGWHYGMIGARLEILRQNKVVASVDKEFGRSISLKGKREDQFVNMQVSVENVALRQENDPQLYRAKVTLLHNGKPADVFEDNFGFRTFEVKDRFFFLNNERIFLKGTNLSGEYVYGINSVFTNSAIIKRYLCDIPKSFHANCIRSHSIPFSQQWLNVADAAGMLILQEFPLTVNYDRRAVDSALRRRAGSQMG